jgi:hypothetical protein
VGQRRRLRQGVKNQKLSESRAQARSSSFDLALQSGRPQNARGREQNAFKPLQNFLNLFLGHDTAISKISLEQIFLSNGPFRFDLHPHHLIMTPFNLTAFFMMR